MHIPEFQIIAHARSSQISKGQRVVFLLQKGRRLRLLRLFHYMDTSCAQRNQSGNSVTLLVHNCVMYELGRNGHDLRVCIVW